MFLLAKQFHISPGSLRSRIGRPFASSPSETFVRIQIFQSLVHVEWIFLFLQCPCMFSYLAFLFVRCHIHLCVLQFLSLFQKLHFIFSVQESQNDGSFHLSISFWKSMASSETLLMYGDVVFVEELDHLILRCLFFSLS